MKCPGPKCNFGLCLACITDKKTLKDPRGHPLTKIKNREERRLACDFCGNFEKGMISCEPCNFDICETCYKDDETPHYHSVDMTLKDGVWNGTNPDSDS
jgi:hypothetical protein